MSLSLSSLVAHKRVLVVVGSGGVGKTTCSAALALAAAQQGRKTLVLTIDPARRLASSMGLTQIDHVARPVESERFVSAGLDPAPLSVMMLDVRRTFDELVARFAPDMETRHRLVQNRIYKEIAGRLAGSHEYAAMEKLRALDAERRYDLIVLDTPPSRNALDFLEAPTKVADALDSVAVQWLMRASSLGARGLGLAGSFVLRRLARFLGSQFLSDIGAFLAEFNQLLGGFHRRAEEVTALFHDPELAFVIVASPDPHAVDEAIFFAEKLTASQLSVGGWVVNRVCPLAPAEATHDLDAKLTTIAPSMSTVDRQHAAAQLLRAWNDVDVLAQADYTQIERLGGQPLTQIPLFEQDVHDLGGLARIAQYLVGYSSVSPASNPTLAM